MDPHLRNIVSRAINRKGEYRDFLNRIGKKPPRDLDAKAQAAHDEVFGNIECLACANCCSTTSPIFRMVDIERLSKHLRIKPQQLIDDHLHIDGDGDYVLNVAPCPFLGPDKYCSVYEARPNACREYPHTNRKKFHQITALTYKNSQMCPAAARVVELLMQQLK